MFFEKKHIRKRNLILHYNGKKCTNQCHEKCEIDKNMNHFVLRVHMSRSFAYKNLYEI